MAGGGTGETSIGNVESVPTKRHARRHLREWVDSYIAT